MFQPDLSEYFHELPDGKATKLESNRINLSGGQRQRISIARALFKDYDMLIMDDATSAPDSETEKGIQENIESLQGKSSLIIVAHRLATTRNLYKVVHVHKRTLENEGSFEELL